MKEKWNATRIEEDLRSNDYYYYILESVDKRKTWQGNILNIFMYGDRCVYYLPDSK